MKVVIAYSEGSDESVHMKTKITVPKGWRSGPVSKLLDFAVETYNGKFPGQAPLSAAEVHFEKEGSGEVIGVEDVLEEVFTEKAEAIALKPGAPPRVGDRASRLAEEARARAEAVERKKREEAGKVRCKNFGCNKLFDPAANPEGGCAHHVGPPFFHDCKKGWTCCSHLKTAMDWEEFNALPTCATGKHSAEGNAPKAKAAPLEEGAAAAAPPAPAPKSISDFNASGDGQAATSATKSAATVGQPKVARYEDGTYRCQNKGCAQKFDPAANGPAACAFHAAPPIFHETYKWWGCCDHAKKAEFDDFLKVPGCRRGPHWDGAGTPPQGEPNRGPPPEDAVIEAGEEGFDLG